jgi:hypothetical protein
MGRHRHDKLAWAAYVRCSKPINCESFAALLKAHYTPELLDEIANERPPAFALIRKRL